MARPENEIHLIERANVIRARQNDLRWTEIEMLEANRLQEIDMEFIRQEQTRRYHHNEDNRRQRELFEAEELAKRQMRDNLETRRAEIYLSSMLRINRSQQGSESIIPTSASQVSGQNQDTLLTPVNRNKCPYEQQKQIKQREPIPDLISFDSRINHINEPSFNERKQGTGVQSPVRHLSDEEVIRQLMTRIEELEMGSQKTTEASKSILKPSSRNSKKSLKDVQKVSWSTTDVSSDESTDSDSSLSSEEVVTTKDRKIRKTIFSTMPNFNIIRSKDDDLVAWFKHFELTAKAQCWNKHQMASQVPLHLGGEALDAWESLKEIDKDNYHAMKNKLLKKMRKSGSESSITKQFLSLVQAEGESVGQLASRLRRLIEGSTKLKKETERKVAKQYVQALKPEISCLLVNSKFKDLDDVVRAAERVESQLFKQTPRQNFSVNQMSIDDSYDMNENPATLQTVNANLQSDSRDNEYRATRQQLICFLCRQVGHRIRDCPRQDNSKLCEFCVRQGHIRDSCPLERDIKLRQVSLNEKASKLGTAGPNRASLTN